MPSKVKKNQKKIMIILQRQINVVILVDREKSKHINDMKSSDVTN